MQIFYIYILALSEANHLDRRILEINSNGLIIEIIL